MYKHDNSSIHEPGRMDRWKWGRTRQKIHGGRLYCIWLGMNARCYNSNLKEFKNWGGRGITVCDEWRESFDVFYDWAITHGYRSLYFIDRVNNDGNYEPDNCRWVTPKQSSGNKRNTIYLNYQGEILPLAVFAERFKIGVDVLRGRLNKGWPIEKALITPIAKIKNRQDCLIFKAALIQAIQESRPLGE